MSKNKGSAITRSFFLRSGRGGTQVCSTTFKVAVGFILTVIICMYAFVLQFFGFNDYTRSTDFIVVINAPQSFLDFEEEHLDEDYRIFHESWDAPYDFMMMSTILHDRSAGLALVFPEDFDSSIKEGQLPQILTYYRTDTLDYKYIRDHFVDNPLEDYKTYLTEQFDLPDTASGWNITRQDISTITGMSQVRIFAYVMGRTFIPILLFIAMMYAAMSSGTEAISGQKERGTFSRILLTPVPRKNIISAFTKGVFIRSYIPVIVITAITFLIPVYRHWESLLPILILTASLAIFIASLTVLISVMNDAVTSAQTAFLPIFFILVTIAVTCINAGTDAEAFYYFIPVYGQFYGIGDAINGEADIISAIACSIITALLAVVIVQISTKLLMSERFTALTSSSEEDDTPKEPSFISRTIDRITGVLDVIITPLVTLSVFQILAMIPVAIVYMGNPAYSDFIASLADIKTVKEIMDKSFEIIGIFMNDPRFLALMSVAYIFIIVILMWRAKGPSGVGLTLKGFKKNYLSGMGLGILMMTLVFALLLITRKATPTGFGLTGNTVLTFIFSLIMWVPQGAAEEVMFRGYMMTKLKRLFGDDKVAGWTAIIISSLLFAAFHGFNGGFSVTALINIFLLAVLFGLICEKTGSIVLTSAAHTMWNMFQGNIYGLSVSGNAAVPSLLAVNYTGSSFGPEGTAEASVIIVAALVAYAVITRSRKHPSPKAS